MKKTYYIPICLLALLIIFLSFKLGKDKCNYPVFDLNYRGQVVHACFKASSLIHHQHKTSVIIEVVSPSATAQGESVYFEDKREMAEFVCQILLQPQNKRPTLYDFSAANSMPDGLIISARNQSLFATFSGPSKKIDLLFCMAPK